MRYAGSYIRTVLIAIVGLGAMLHAQDNTSLAKKLANPVSPMMTFPLQFNYDRGFSGTSGNESNQWLLNVQPIVPFSLNDEWNLVSRTVAPLVRTDNIPFGSGVHSAAGDIVQTLFFLPKYPTQSGWILGAGPVFLLPSGSELSTKSWGGGAAVIALKQENEITYGIHVNHVESFAGSTDVSNTLLQPFFTYTTSNAVSYSIASDTTYNWESPSSDRFTVPLIAMVSKVFSVGKQSISLGIGAKYYLQSPNNGPEGFGARFMMTFLFPGAK
jgi:hypothetical protein